MTPERFNQLPKYACPKDDPALKPPTEKPVSDMNEAEVMQDIAYSLRSVRDWADRT